MGLLLSGNSNISEAFFEQHIDKVDWGNLSNNNFNTYISRMENNLLKYQQRNSLINFQRIFKEWLYSPRNPNLSVYLKKLWITDE